MENNIYLTLTEEFNKGRLRAIISSGQAVVLHGLAVMSKDGDWIIREDEETTKYVLRILAKYKAEYRFGAPLDKRWLSGGWSSHFEFMYNNIRVRTDFFTRPPRLSEQSLHKLWQEQEKNPLPFLDIKRLAEIKKTNREKDYVVIGELARLMKDPIDQLLYSRSARDIVRLAQVCPDTSVKIRKVRPLLKEITTGMERLEAELDAERRTLIHANEKRLKKYINASRRWLTLWPKIQKETANLSLMESHKTITKRAEKVLPFFV